MAPVSREPNVLDKNSSLAAASRLGAQSPVGSGVDALWQYQLRREHKALLDQITSLAKESRNDTMGTEKKLRHIEERLQAVEVKLVGIQNDLTTRYAAIEKHITEQVALNNEQAAFRNGIKNLLQQQVSNEELQSIMTGSASPHQTPRYALASILNKEPPSISKQAQPTRPKPLHYVNAEERHGGNQPILDNTLQLPTQSTRARSPILPTRRFNARSRSKSIESRSTIETAEVVPAVTIKTLKLSQNHSSYLKYHHRASEIFAALPNKDTKLEIDFVNTFIRGITTDRSREKLVDELQQIHPSRNKKDGKIEILCDWEDVIGGMRRAGMLESRGEKEKLKETGFSKKKRILNPRGQVETGLMS